MIYVLNSPVLTAYGDYRYRASTKDEAVDLLRTGFVSAVGHAATADFLSRLLEMDVRENRIRVAMEPGDQALVFALKTRLEEGRVLDETSIRSIPYELALLERIA